MMKRILFFAVFCMFFLFTCGEDDPCDGISCGDRGRCVNGICECELGYGGADCSQALLPTRMTITNTEITSWPATDNSGAGWDPFDAPDVYLVITDNVTGTQLFNGGVFVNTTPPISYSTDITIPNPGNEIGFSLFDNDTLDPDDYISGMVITLGEFSRERDFPVTADLDLITTNNTRIVISMEYEF